MSGLIKRTFRIRKDQDKKIKRLGRSTSESQVIRDAVDKMPDIIRKRTK